LVLAASLLAGVTPGAAIVIRHDRPAEAYAAAPDEFPTLVTIHPRGGLGTLVAPSWVLTAAHVAHRVTAGHVVALGGREAVVRRVVLHPGWRTPQTNVVDDVALLELERPVEGVEPTPLYRGRDEVGREVVFAGRGGGGNGRDGLSGRAPGLRRATNRIERADDRWLVFRFDPPQTATAMEGISGPGDSGGPAFLDTGAGAQLAGVSSWQDSRLQGREGVYGVLEHYARVSSYAPWVDAVIGARGNAAGAGASSKPKRFPPTARRVRPGCQTAFSS
jgi:hypothetical protein